MAFIGNMQKNPDVKSSLIRILQNAYSGELGAARVYDMHARALRDPHEAVKIKQIAGEEWAHRKKAGEWLSYLGAKPLLYKEAIFWAIGSIAGPLCYVTGHFMPMYFAGWLENGNVKEYEDAASFARELGMSDCEADMLDMACAEAKHEAFFHDTVSKHRLLPVMRSVFRWS